MDIENLTLYELTDEEIDNLTDKEVLEIGEHYTQHGIPQHSTVKGLLKKFNLKYDDLEKFVLDMNVGICNNANRTKTQIYINRKNSAKKDNITINLNKNRDVPYVTVQMQVGDYFIHEEAYDEKGLKLYQS